MTPETMLLRQVHPQFIQEGRISSQVFKPTPKDENLLSVYDGDQITAERAWLHFTSELKFSSVGVVAVTVGECHGQDLTVRPDPEPFPEHVVIDFSGCSRGQLEKKSKRLRDIAESRGWLYQHQS